MRILHIDEQRGWRGGEQQASWLINGLVRAGHSCWIAGRPQSAFVTGDHGVKVQERIEAPLRHELDLRSARILARAVCAHGIEIIHAHTSHAHSLALWTRLFAGRGKVVVHRRVSFPPRKDPINRLKYRLPDKLLCVSEEVARVLHGYGLAKDHAVTVPSSVDLKRLEVAPANREDFGIPADSCLVFNAGALVGHKDHATLLRAFALLSHWRPDTYLLIAGDGDLETALKTQARELGIDGVVRFLGRREDVPALLAMSDLYVSSSISEGLGTSVLEALAARIPVVATEAGGVGEMVHHEKTGLLVANRSPEKLADAMNQALANPEATRAYVAAGRALVEARYTTTRMVENTIREYELLLGA